jgi:hypothetical protein
MIAVPTSCAALCTQLAELAQRIDDELAQTGSGVAIDYGAVEQRIADALGAFERGLHAQILARLDIDVPAIRVWGDEYRRIGRFESDYHTLAGTVRVMRTVYRKTERNGDTLDPVSVRAGVVDDGWLPHTARAMAHMLAQGTSREAEATGRELARLPIRARARRRHRVGRGRARRHRDGGRAADWLAGPVDARVRDPMLRNRALAGDISGSVEAVTGGGELWAERLQRRGIGTPRPGREPQARSPAWVVRPGLHCPRSRHARRCHRADKLSSPLHRRCACRPSGRAPAGGGELLALAGRRRRRPGSRTHESQRWRPGRARRARAGTRCRGAKHLRAGTPRPVRTVEIVVAFSAGR